MMAEQQSGQARQCVYCNSPAEGNYSVHRDGFGVGPEVDLCDACGQGELPSLAEIWGRIALPSTDQCAYLRVEP